MSDNHSGVPTGGDSAPVELNVGASDDQGSVETTARSIYDELLELLVESKGQIANVAALVREGVTDRTEMVERGAAANTGAGGEPVDEDVLEFSYALYASDDPSVLVTEALAMCPEHRWSELGEVHLRASDGVLTPAHLAAATAEARERLGN